jgi:small subunit ribosomal protein S16
VAVKIRLKRLGKIHAPFYRIVVADSRTKRDGRVIEEIGKYHPTQDPSVIEVNSDRAQYWLGVGAQPTEQVMALLKLTGDWGIFKGDKNAKSTVKFAEPKVAFSPDAKKKPVLRPKALKPPVEDAPVSQPAAEVVTAEETPAKAPAVEEAPAAEEAAPAVTEEASEAPAAQAPAEEAAAEETPAEAPVAEETPVVEETPAEEVVAVADVASEEAPAKETKPAE